MPEFRDELEDVSLSDNELEKDSISNAQATNLSSKPQRKVKMDKQKEARKDRRALMKVVDTQLDLEEALSSNPKKAGFRYRGTSPTSFGLTAGDILMAGDSQLNEFAGLKKLAAFRDTSKKLKDKRHLGKKARLRKWRQETFGDEAGPAITSASAQNANANGASTADIDGDEPSKQKRKRHSKKSKRSKTPMTSNT